MYTVYRFPYTSVQFNEENQKQCCLDSCNASVEPSMGYSWGILNNKPSAQLARSTINTEYSGGF